MTRHFILDGKTVKPASLMEWGRFFEDFEKRVVGRDQIGEMTVSTVFLGLDHSFGMGPPVLFETMIGGACPDGGWDHQSRYCTYEQAEEGHALAVEWARSVQDLAQERAASLVDKLKT